MHDKDKDEDKNMMHVADLSGFYVTASYDVLTSQMTSYADVKLGYYALHGDDARHVRVWLWATNVGFLMSLDRHFAYKPLLSISAYSRPHQLLKYNV